MTPARALASILGVFIVVVIIVIGFKVFYRPTANATDDIATAIQDLLKKKPSAAKQKYKPFEWREDAEPKLITTVPCVAKGIPGFRGVGHDGKTGCVH